MGVDHVIPQFAMRMRDLPAGVRKFPIQGTGWETRSFCHIDDCVHGLMCLYELGEDREVYHLGNPFEECTIRKLAYMVAHGFGRSIEVVPGDLPKGSPTRRAPDISKLQALGYQPTVTLRDGLPGTLDWYRKVEVAV
jgi:nucleoside-diphosphate-sugar epimerase